MSGAARRYSCDSRQLAGAVAHYLAGVVSLCITLGLLHVVGQGLNKSAPVAARSLDRLISDLDFGEDVQGIPLGLHKLARVDGGQGAGVGPVANTASDTIREAHFNLVAFNVLLVALQLS